MWKSIQIGSTPRTDWPLTDEYVQNRRDVIKQTRVDTVLLDLPLIFIWVRDARSGKQTFCYIHKSLFDG